MKFRNLIFVLAIAFSAIFATMIGTSYAYYIATGGTTFNVTTGNINTGVAVVFTQSQYINVNTGVPIETSLVDTRASASTFELAPSSEILRGYEVAVNISIIDISIDEALQNTDYFKYKLSCSSDGTTFTDLSSGTGRSFTTDSLELGTLSTNDGTFDIEKTYTCTLRVWLEESGEIQNDLMNKKFRGLIKVNTLFKK